MSLECPCCELVHDGQASQCGCDSWVSFDSEPCVACDRARPSRSRQTSRIPWMEPKWCPGIRSTRETLLVLRRDMKQGRE